MAKKIAIQPDHLVNRNGEKQSFSDRWFHLCKELGLDALEIDVYSENAIDEIIDCDAFMWRPTPSFNVRNYATKIIRCVEEVSDIPCFFNTSMLRSFEDKVSQKYEFMAAKIPTPETYVFWSKEAALNFCKGAKYPLVLKLANGYQSYNVLLIENYFSAEFYVDLLFGSGTVHLGYKPASKFRQFLRRLRQCSMLLNGKHPNAPNSEADVQHGYFYLQEFLEGNEFDIRITIIGNRAFSFRRFNREGDFRASGSGLIDFDQNRIEKEAIILAKKVAIKLKLPVVAVDLLKKDNEYVVCEYNVAFASFGIKKSPGYWRINEDFENGDIDWVVGNYDPADLIFNDFINNTF